MFKNRVENESGMKIKCLRLDRGVEFTSSEFNTFFKVNGIKRKLSAPKTPDENSIAKRRNNFVIEATRSMIFENIKVILERRI